MGGMGKRQLARGKETTDMGKLALGSRLASPLAKGGLRGICKSALDLPHPLLGKEGSYPAGSGHAKHVQSLPMPPNRE